MKGNPNNKDENDYLYSYEERLEQHILNKETRTGNQRNRDQDWKKSSIILNFVAQAQVTDGSASSSRRRSLHIRRKKGIKIDFAEKKEQLPQNRNSISQQVGK